MECQYLPYQLRNVLRVSVLLMIAVIVNAWWKKINVGSIRKLSELYTTETVDLLFHLCGHSNHYDRVDEDVLVVCTANGDEDHVTMYLGYYDCGISRRSHGLDLWIVILLCNIIMYMAKCRMDTLFV